jgi:hypothetical protein
VKRHAFDPIFFVLGLAFAALGLFFLVGDRTAADIGWEWIWPVAVAVLGLLFVISAGRRLVPEREPSFEDAPVLTPESAGDADPD